MLWILPYPPPACAPLVWLGLVHDSLGWYSQTPLTSPSHPIPHLTHLTRTHLRPHARMNVTPAHAHAATTRSWSATAWRWSRCCTSTASTWRCTATCTDTSAPSSVYGRAGGFGVGFWTKHVCLGNRFANGFQACCWCRQRGMNGDEWSHVNLENASGHGAVTVLAH